MEKTTLKSRYDQLKTKREPFLGRARQYAALTIPSILPPDGNGYSSRLPVPYQGMGARGVKHLAALLTKAFLPTGNPFFRLSIPPQTLAMSGQNTVPAEVEKGLAIAELQVSSEIEAKAWRRPTYLTLQHLIVSGNALEWMLTDNTIRVFRLDQFVAVRDPSGRLVECIIEEKVHPFTLPEELQALIPGRDGKSRSVDEPVELHTSFKRDADGKFQSYQEVAGVHVPGSDGKFEPDALPISALRWAEVAGEDYGRGMCEEHEGDLRALEGHSKAMIEGTAMAARHITLVRPNAAGGNLRQRIAKANNGDVLAGNPDDVSMLQFQNVAGLQIGQSEIERIGRNLAAAFMLSTDLRRDAERVTAEEVRMLVRELEESLGGVYTLLAADMQLVRVRRLIVQMQKNEQLPVWNDQQVQPTIITGLEALERQADVSRVTTAITTLAPLEPSGAFDYVPLGPLLSKFLIGLGLPGEVRTEAEVQQLRMQRAQQQAQEQGMAAGAVTAAEAANAPPEQPTQ